MSELDALLAPSTPCVAPLQDCRQVTIRGAHVELRTALLQCVLAPSQLAFPVVALSIGSHEALTFGMQIIGRPFSERPLPSIAAACEERWRWTAPA